MGFQIAKTKELPGASPPGPPPGLCPGPTWGPPTAPMTPGQFQDFRFWELSPMSLLIASNTCITDR